MSFTVSVLPAARSGLKLRKGVVNGLVWEQEAGNGMPLVTSVTPGATLTNVALFIDSNKYSLHPAASTEDWCACCCLLSIFTLCRVACERDWLPVVWTQTTCTNPCLRIALLPDQARRLGRRMGRLGRRLGPWCVPAWDPSFL